jgi:hypothetical protein
MVDPNNITSNGRSVLQFLQNTHHDAFDDCVHRLLLVLSLEWQLPFTKKYCKTRQHAACIHHAEQ